MERSAKCSICCKIQSTGTVVKNQKFRFLYNGTCDSKTLTLTAGKISSILFQFEIKLSIFVFYNFTSLCGRECIPDFFICCILTSPFHVFADGSFKKYSALWNNTDLFTKVMLAVVLDILPVYLYSSAGRIIKTGNQVDQGGFTASGTSDDSNSLASFDRKADIGKAGCA